MFLTKKYFRRLHLHQLFAGLLLSLRIVDGFLHKFHVRVNDTRQNTQHNLNTIFLRQPIRFFNQKQQQQPQNNNYNDGWKV